MKYLLLVTILFPILGSLLVIFNRNEHKVHYLSVIISLITSILVWILILNITNEKLELIRFSKDLAFVINFDGFGKFFAGVVSLLYPLTTLYAVEYMEDDTRPKSFFFFFLIAYGVTLGVTMADDFFTLYVFYELLTLSTMPLVLHLNDRKSVKAARTYLYVSIGGASLAFASMIYVLNNPLLERNTMTQLFYVIGFFGFGVKAAVFPTHFWLPKASCAPTPVTALLHAVAVVKAGVFAIIRLTYYIYGVDNIINSFGQYIPMIFAIFTIFYGSSMALKETHFKRRMAYSTVANLSYIIFGALLMTKSGYIAALLHMAFHAEIKILGFFAVGAVMHNTGREYLPELDGVGRKMPITFVCYTVAALALTGIPPLSGFVSKAYLLMAGIETNTKLGMLGVIILIVSAILTAMYSLTPARRAFWPEKSIDESSLTDIKEVRWQMLVPMIILTIAIIVTGFTSGFFIRLITNIYNTLGGWM